MLLILGCSFIAQAEHLAEMHLQESLLDLAEREHSYISALDLDFDTIAAAAGFTKQALAMISKDPGAFYRSTRLPCVADPRSQMSSWRLEMPTSTTCSSSRFSISSTKLATPKSSPSEHVRLFSLESILMPALQETSSPTRRPRRQLVRSQCRARPRLRDPSLQQLCDRYRRRQGAFLPSVPSPSSLMTWDSSSRPTLRTTAPKSGPLNGRSRSPPSSRSLRKSLQPSLGSKRSVLWTRSALC